MRPIKPEGKIVTFYSFKGGVGRTMALANVAFLAAMNDLKVLVMDWDLEAPGLSYYFRGLLDPQQAKSVKEAPGILNVLCEWSDTVSGGKPSVIKDSFEAIQSGAKFSLCLRSLVPSEMMGTGGSLDYIGAGSKIISTSEYVPYEEALANFSWQKFFDREAGGAVLNSLRDWCKAQYDLILIDSRTGLADVAGICTMQIPDEVVLCFILNKQNIDGVSRVSFAIRQKRQEKIKLRAIPMRTAREGTSEESDARAKAISELTRVGGFSTESLNDDFKLAIRAADNVPFYETLAPLISDDPSLDVFSANYRQLASQICGRPLKVPDLTSAFKDLVRRRLQPRHATAEYVRSLLSSEPLRAVSELHRLIESAYEEEIDGGVLDDEYVAALANVAFAFSDHVEAPEAESMVERALDLLRALYSEDEAKWSGPLLEALDQYWTSVHVLDPELQLSVLEEIDGLISTNLTVAGRIRRLDYKRAAARISFGMNDAEALAQSMREIGDLIGMLRSDNPQLPADQAEALLVNEAELQRLKGDQKSRAGDPQGALECFEQGLKVIRRHGSQEVKGDLLRAKFYLHVRAGLTYVGAGRNADAVAHSIAAAEIGGGPRALIAGVFVTLARPIVSVESVEDAILYCSLSLLPDPVRSVSSLANMAGRNAMLTVDLVTTAASLADLVARSVDVRVPAILKVLSDASKQSLVSLSRRRNVLAPQQLTLVVDAADRLRTSLQDAGEIEDDAADWESAIGQLNRKGGSAKPGRGAR